MKRLANFLVLSLCAASPLMAQETTSEQSAAEQSVEIYAKGYDKFRFGGYGEALANFMDYGINRYTRPEGNEKTHRNSISIPRFVLAFDYKFNSKWILGAEIEFEAGGTGSAYELENTENGEYETEVEKGGEVALEQFHITRLIHPAFNVRAGHLIVPVGLTNGNTWVASGKQGIFETDNFTSPAYVARLNYLGVPGLKLGGSFYYCHNTGANSDKTATYKSIGNIPLRIYTADVQYKNKYLTARANMIYGNLGNTVELSNANGKLSGLSPYSRVTPIAKNAVSYGGEVGFNLRSLCRDNTRVPVIYPFVRYEYYNPQEEVLSPHTAELRNKVSMWTAGANWYALPNLVVKADYTTRRIGGGKYNSENEFSLGVAYIAWFLNK